MDAPPCLKVTHKTFGTQNSSATMIYCRLSVPVECHSSFSHSPCMDSDAFQKRWGRGGSSSQRCSACLLQNWLCLLLTAPWHSWSPVCRVPSAFSQEGNKDVCSYVCVPMCMCVCAQCIIRGPIKLNHVTSSGHVSALLKFSESLASLQPVIPMFWSRKECKCMRGCNCCCHCVKLEASVGKFYLLCITMASVQPSSCVIHE